MKKYTVTFDVPDDFVPEEMELTANYKDDIVISAEGFYDIQEIIKSIPGMEIEELKPDSSSVYLLKFPKEWALDPDRYFGVIDGVRAGLEELTDRPVISFVDDLDILAQNSAQAIDMLNKMIAKINLRSSIKLV